MSAIRIHLGRKREFAGGLFLVLLGILMPLILNIYNMGVYRACMAALSEISEVRVLEAALRLWALNTLRAFPHYLGAFFLADTVSIEFRGLGNLIKCGFMGAIILFVYQVIELVYHIQYDIGVPAISVIIILIVLIRIDFRMVSALKKAIAVFFLLCTFQCLDIMPFLGGYGFGRGETSQMIKGIADFLDMKGSLNFMTLFLMLLMLLNFILYVMLISDENHIKQANLEKELKSQELMEIRMKAFRSRTDMEMEQLVHDLKTPLTSIQTLVGVLKITDQKEKQVQYLNRIEMSIENLSEQISEILDEGRAKTISVGQFMNGLEAQTSHMNYRYLITVQVENPDSRIRVNRIRFYRMLVNLIENAYYAVDPEYGSIRCVVRDSEKDGVPMVEFEVADNGMGMSDDTAAQIFETGFSTRGSSGLGMRFVKHVVERHGGSVEVNSILHEGTKIRVWIPGEEEEDEE